MKHLLITSARNLLVLIAAVLSQGCAGIDFDYPRPESQVLSGTQGTWLGQQIEPEIIGKPAGQSGFYPLADGVEALSIRLLLARRAERSIDLQYYLIKDGVASRALVGELLAAANRGVRVRLLLDDMFTSGYDTRLAALDAHPNFEIRVFNPFYRGIGGRVRSGLTGFARVNRRMHNKTFTVDGQATVIGGRNIADEYFDARDDVRFSDLDVLAIGPVVADASSMFDTYWNHETVLPVPAFAQMPADPAAELERMRDALASFRDDILDSPYAEAVRQQALAFSAATADGFEWAPYSLIYDSPDKGIRKRASTAPSIMTPLIGAFDSAESEVIVISPYLVPRKSGVEGFAKLRERGVDVTIITNSLAANNQFAVHGGYAPSRKGLLASGVRLYETRPDAESPNTTFAAAQGATATLHTKAFLIDDRSLFIGSFNFDPRSAYINTESGVIIHAPGITRRFADAVESALVRDTYELFLDEQKRLRWRESREGEDVIWTHEPQTGLLQRVIANFVRILPIRGQL